MNHSLALTVSPSLSRYQLRCKQHKNILYYGLHAELNFSYRFVGFFGLNRNVFGLFIFVFLIYINSSELYLYVMSCIALLIHKLQELWEEESMFFSRVMLGIGRSSRYLTLHDMSKRDQTM